jgi:TetR/AcrR family transcriptional regulator, transcriptional repressor for nem operon
MARPREFDKDAALQKAVDVFWEKGFAGTTTDDLVDRMGIGRQSLYNTFGDKHRLYVEALGCYQRASLAAHLERLRQPRSPIEGLAALLNGLAPDDDAMRRLGCMGVRSMAEFGTTDPELLEMRARENPVLYAGVLERIHEGQAQGEIEASIDAADAARFVQVTMVGMQSIARGGASADELKRHAAFAIDRLRTR